MGEDYAPSDRVFARAIWESHLLRGGPAPDWLLNRLRDHRTQALTTVQAENEALKAELAAERAKVKALQLVLIAAERLRAAQQAYMANRGNDTLGRVVGSSAISLDGAISQARAILSETQT